MQTQKHTLIQQKIDIFLCHHPHHRVFSRNIFFIFPIPSNVVFLPLYRKRDKYYRLFQNPFLYLYIFLEVMLFINIVLGILTRFYLSAFFHFLRKVQFTFINQYYIVTCHIYYQKNKTLEHCIDFQKFETIYVYILQNMIF